LFTDLESINLRPKPFEFYTASDLWTNEYTSEVMLSFHLDENNDFSSRNGKFINWSVEWIASRFNLGNGIRVVDFGCGPGLYTNRLAKTGAEVTGIDFSSRSIKYAREVAARERLNIRYINQNYLEFETDDRYHLIMMIMCDFCALSPAQRKTIMAKFHTFLHPGGSVILDAYTLNAFTQRKETAMYEENLLNHFWSPNKYYGFLNTFKYEQEKVVLDKYTIIEANRTRTVYNWLQYFDPQELAKEFQEYGFDVDGLYADVAGSPFDPTANEFAIVGKKK
jgi:2-polyprenyl-3-methyl-5-hydroxy-6-metoxy-1,4-benzoquinol methylase